jgi:hypothetical protein
MERPPIAWCENHRDDSCIAGVVPLQRTGHLQVIAIVGCDKVGADEEEDDRCTVQSEIPVDSTS